MIRRKKPRVAVWDIETGLEAALVFRLNNKYRALPHDSLLTERYIICGAWQWLGQKKINAVALSDFPNRFKRNPHDDRNVVMALHKMLSEADAVVAHYGDNFDMKFFNTRCVMNGLPPIHNLVQIDTYKIARRKFMFNNNRLDYIGKKLVGYGKTVADYKLWKDCYFGVKRAVLDMKAYCKQDVRLLSDVYKVLAPFVPARLNARLFTDRAVCESCMSENIQYRGYRYTRKTTWREFVCKDCGNWGSQPL